MAKNQGGAAGSQAAKGSGKETQSQAAAQESTESAKASEDESAGSQAAAAKPAQSKKKLVWKTDTRHNGKFYRQGEEADLEGTEKEALLKHGVLVEAED